LPAKPKFSAILPTKKDICDGGLTMSEHDIADCPNCGKRDYVLKEDNVWICLKCHHTEKMPKSRFDPESEGNPNILSVLIAAFIVAMFMMVAMGGRLTLTPNQNVDREPQLHY